MRIRRVRESLANRLAPSNALLIWVALQLGGLATLLAGYALLWAARPLFGGDASFLGRWSVVFVLVPITFAPALIAWHSWAVRRFGKRGGFFRLVAEVAFAAELIGCVLYQRLA